MPGSSRVDTAMKVYAVVCKDTANVIAKELHMQGKLKLNGLKLAILDYNADQYDREALKIVEVFLSSTAGHVKKTEELDIDAFVTPNDYHCYGDADLLYLSRNPAHTIAQCTVCDKSKVLLDAGYVESIHL